MYFDNAKPALPLDAPSLRILVAEDNPVNREIALRMLEKLGFAADAAANGQEAVDKHRAQAYDLVLMDCEMPVLDGYQATPHIRTLDGAARRTRIIALTASTDDNQRERCLAAGMDDFLPKPLRPQLLAELLTRWPPVAPGYPDDEPDATPASCSDELDTVRQMFGADFAELSALYQIDSPPRIAAMRRALADANMAELSRIAHALAGSSMSIGAKGLFALCRELEQRAEAGMLDDAAERLRAIEAEYRRICGRLQDMLRQH